MKQHMIELDDRTATRLKAIAALKNETKKNLIVSILQQYTDNNQKYFA